MQVQILSLLRTASVVALISCASVASSAVAAGGDWVSAEYTQVRLIAAAESVAGNSILTIGVHIRLEEGWKTYWRSPGDAGIPPTFDWSMSANVFETRIEWPVPEELVQFGMTTYGYRDEIVFPLQVVVADPSQLVRLRLAFGYAVCREVCIPVRAHLTLNIPAIGGEPNMAFAALINRFRARVPQEPTLAGMSVERVTMSADIARSLEIAVRAREPFVDPRIILEGPPGIAFGQPSVRLLTGGHRAVVILGVEGPEETHLGLVDSLVTVTLIDQGRVVERTLLVKQSY